MKKTILLIIAVLILAFIIIEILPNKTTINRSSVNGIYELEQVELGNYKQSVLIRGFDRNNPLIIFLHGGPGFASISYIKKFQREIEKDYVTVNWDQRGSGRSFSLFMDGKKMNENQLLNDLDELVDYVRTKLNKEKVYIAGHSWGTVLGKDYVQLHPEKVLYYVAIGQYVSEIESDRYSYDYILAEATATNDQKTLNKIAKLGKPPYSGDIVREAAFRKCVNRYGGNEISVHIGKEMFTGTITEPEYSILDLFRLIIGNYYSVYNMHAGFAKRDFRNESLTFDVPVLFIAGRKDLVTNSLLAEEYFNMIKSPDKKLVWFEKSAHDPQYEETGKFSSLLRSIAE